MNYSAILQYKENIVDEKEIIDLLKNLISIRSYFFEEEEIMKYVYEILEEKGLEPRYHYYDEKAVTGFSGVNVVGEIKGKNDGVSVLINGHLDTVKICDGWDTNPLEGVIHDGKMYGLGSIDMKSGCVAAIIALEMFKKNYPDFSGRIVYTFVSDEEGPFGLGTSSTIDDGLCDGIDLAIVPEPSSGFCKSTFPSLCLGARGGYSYRVDLTGKTAHAANPENGISAIVDASKLILELKQTEFFEHERLGKGSICITDINSQSSGCSVVEKASFSVFRHIVPGETKETIIEEVKQAAIRAGVKSKYNVNIRRAPSEDTDGFMPYIVDEDNKYTQKFLKSIKTVCEKDAEISYFTSIGDFCYLGTRANVPTYVFGPHGSNFHTANEYVEIDSVVKTTKVIYQFLIDLLT